jgi:hypothetical protein
MITFFWITGRSAINENEILSNRYEEMKVHAVDRTLKTVICLKKDM